MFERGYGRTFILLLLLFERGFLDVRNSVRVLVGHNCRGDTSGGDVVGRIFESGNFFFFLRGGVFCKCKRPKKTGKSNRHDFLTETLFIRVNVTVCFVTGT